MKVEFLDSDILGPHLFVTKNEFIQAEKSDNEFESLQHAVEAFCKLFDVDYVIYEDEYSAVLDMLEKDGAVIFTICESKYPTKRWCEIQVSNSNHLQTVVYEDETGYHIRRRGKLNSNALKGISQRKGVHSK